MTQAIKSAVIVIGGGEDKVYERKLLKSFIYHAGGSSARVAIIPSASREPHIIGQIYTDIFQELGASAVNVWGHSRSGASPRPQYVKRCNGRIFNWRRSGASLRPCW
jgi:cyanophycinase